MAHNEHEERVGELGEGLMETGGRRRSRRLNGEDEVGDDIFKRGKAQYGAICLGECHHPHVKCAIWNYTFGPSWPLMPALQWCA